MFKNTLTRILFSFLSVIFILAALGILGLSAGSRTVNSQIYNTISENTHNVTSNLNTTLKLLHSQNCGLASQSSILKLAKTSFLLDEYERISIANQLREQLTSIADSSPLVKHVRIYFRQLGKMYNSTGHPGGSFHTFSPEQYQEIFSLAEPNGPTCYQNPLDGLETLSLFIYSVESKDDFLIEIVLSPEYFEELFDSNSFFGRDYYYVTIMDQITITNLPDEIRRDFDPVHVSETANSRSSYKVNGDAFFCVMQSVPFLKCNYLRMVSAGEYTAPIVTITRLMFCILAAVFFGSLLFLFVAYRMLHMPLQKLVNGFARLETGDFSVRLPADRASDFNYIYQSFNSMTENLSGLIEREYSMKLLLQKAEFKQLQSQINPHFLYNSFFLLKSAIMEGLQEDAAKIASLLGQYFRYITRNSIEQVPLKDEYYHAVLYSEIQALRFEGRIRIELEPLPAAYEDLMVPKLILQPIMENAFLHGLDHKLKDGILSLKFFPGRDTVTIQIEDNSDQLSDETLQALTELLCEADRTPERREMTGLLNIRRRLSLYSDHQSRLTVSRSALGGLCVSIRLSLQSLR